MNPGTDWECTTTYSLMFETLLPATTTLTDVKILTLQGTI